MNPLILPTGPHGLRSRLDTAFAQAARGAALAMEIDSLALLMDAVDMGLGSTIQPWAAVGRYARRGERFVMAEISKMAPAFRPARAVQPVGRRALARRRWPRAWCWATARCVSSCPSRRAAPARSWPAPWRTSSPSSSGQTVYVDNKGGGAGVPAMTEVAKAAPDGHTMILGHVGSLAVNPYILTTSPTT
jgi:DNA-binding transcriptional LysR family regulator